HLWRYLNVTEFHQVRRQPLQHFCAELTVRHFTSAERNRSSNFIAFLQPVACSLHSIAVIVVVSTWSKLDLLYRNRYLVLLGLVSFLFLLVEKLSVIDQFTDRRLSVGSDLDEIDTSGSCFLNSIPRIHDAQGFTIFRNNSYRRNADAFIRPVKRLPKTRPLVSSTKSSCDIASFCKKTVLK